MAVTGAAQAEFGYDGEGRRIYSTTGLTTTVFVGSYFEWNAASGEGVSYYYAGATRLAMRTGGQAAVFFVTDHLGSVNQMVDPYGAPLTGERQLYKPWGEKRLNTSISLTRVGYTGQYDQAEIGLMFYQARWYDAGIIQFNQPDTLIPDPYNTLDWNRYGYARYNALKYTDPTGHSVEPNSPYYTNSNGWLEIIVAIIITVAVLDNLGRRRSHGSGDYSEASLAECFKQKNLREFSDHEQIDPKEFNDMLEAIYDDLNDDSYRGAYDPARMEYDTPFFDGNPRFGEATHTDQIVCINDKCSKQSAVNYVAQGMYSASAGQSLEDAFTLAERWSQQYGHPATKDELYWLEYGYNYYLQLDKQLAK